MAKLVSSGKDILFTILPYSLDTSVQVELFTNPSDYVLGYINDEFKFIYTESGVPTESPNHWSLAIVKALPYYEAGGSWIVYACSPRQVALEFGKILNKSHQTLHIYNWDIWTVERKESKIAIITSWEIF